MAPHPYAHRLIYALDENFLGCTDYTAAHVLATKKFDNTLEALRDTGVTIKVNSVARILGGLSLVTIASAGCRIFADYKLFDVQSTIANDGSWLQLVPDLNILTVAERVHPVVFEKLATQLPNTTIAPVGPLTDLTDDEFKMFGEKDRSTATLRFFKRVANLPAKGMVCSAKDIGKMPKKLRAQVKTICPAIRPSWATVAGDTNAINALTHQDAIRAGADILVVGSPLRYNGDLRETHFASWTKLVNFWKVNVAKYFATIRTGRLTPPGFSLSVLFLYFCYSSHIIPSGQFRPITMEDDDDHA